MLWNNLYKFLNLHHLSCQKVLKKYQFFSPYVKLSLVSRSKKTWGSKCPSSLWEGGGYKFPFLLSLTPARDKKHRSGVYSSVFYLVQTTEIQEKKGSCWETTGRLVRVRHFPGESSVPTHDVGRQRAGFWWRQRTAGGSSGDSRGRLGR